MMQSLISYILLAAGLLASLALFLSVKREMWSAASRNRRQIERIERCLEEARAQESRCEPAIAPGPVRAGMNLSKRVQAMRMLRRHEDIAHVSAALGVAQKEVELLVRVQKMSATAGK